MRPQQKSQFPQMFVPLAIILLLLPTTVVAHEGLHEQIATVTNQIKREPKNASLYLKRGELYRHHRDWQKALADYKRAARLNPKLIAVDLGRGKLFLDSGQPQLAKVALNRFLSKRPEHVEALVTRARVLVKLNQRLDAAKDFTQAIALLPRPEPEFYIERALALVAEGGIYRAQALQGLDEGINKLGPVVTMQLLAIDLELAQKRYDAALARLDQLAAQSPRKDIWLARRSEILEQAGRTFEARAALRAALAAIEVLPSHTRQTKATSELEAHLRAVLKP